MWISSYTPSSPWRLTPSPSRRYGPLSPYSRPCPPCSPATPAPPKAVVQGSCLDGAGPSSTQPHHPGSSMMPLTYSSPPSATTPWGSSCSPQCTSTPIRTINPAAPFSSTSPPSPPTSEQPLSLEATSTCHGPLPVILWQQHAAAMDACSAFAQPSQPTPPPTSPALGVSPRRPASTKFSSRERDPSRMQMFSPRPRPTSPFSSQSNPWKA